MKFSKAKWLESANAQSEQGVLPPREVDDALDIWVNEMDGKTEEEIKASGGEVNPMWLV